MKHETLLSAMWLPAWLYFSFFLFDEYFGKPRKALTPQNMKLEVAREHCIGPPADQKHPHTTIARTQGPRRPPWRSHTRIRDRRVFLPGSKPLRKDSLLPPVSPVCPPTPGRVSFLSSLAAASLTSFGFSEQPLPASLLFLA